MHLWMRLKSYGHGYMNGTKWRDIMSYKSSCVGCPLLAVWSNPTIKIQGEPAGTAQADNAEFGPQHRLPRSFCM